MISPSKEDHSVVDVPLGDEEEGHVEDAAPDEKSLQSSNVYKKKPVSRKVVILTWVVAIALALISVLIGVLVAKPWSSSSAAAADQQTSGVGTSCSSCDEHKAEKIRWCNDLTEPERAEFSINTCSSFVDKWYTACAQYCDDGDDGDDGGDGDSGNTDKAPEDKNNNDDKGEVHSEVSSNKDKDSGAEDSGTDGPATSSPLSITPWPYSSDIAADPGVTYGSLENGLRYMIMKNSEPRNKLMLRMHVDAGSLQEEDDQLGIAHFLEVSLYLFVPVMHHCCVIASSNLSFASCTAAHGI